MGLIQYVVSFLLLTQTFSTGQNQSRRLSRAFINNQVVPDVVPNVPGTLVRVTYRQNAKVRLGNILPVNAVLAQPRKVCWNVNSNTFYTLALVDADVPSRAAPVLREYVHWLVGNIPGKNLARGMTLASYQSPTPIPGSGPHRYVFLVYRQQGFVQFNEPIIQVNRTNFSIRRFADKYGLTLFAGNFYQATAANLV